MNMHIKEFASLTGVSVRTLHYYDAIGLLKPSFVDEQNGYRFYNEESLKRMQEILFYRELDFSLKSIAQILSSKNYDRQAALQEQRKLLILKKNRLERLIAALADAEKGEITMDAFDNSEYETARKQYADEAKEKWGDTEAYRESVRKTADYSKEKWKTVNAAMDGILAEFAACMQSGAKPADDAVQVLVKKWQTHITENYYVCTDEILRGLGEMYVCDGRFQQNIDKHGSGTAEFMTAAIRAYCAK